MKEVLLESHLPELGQAVRGKVRDIYDLGDSLLFVATDRISAFDVILPEGIPGKGNVLTQLSLYWFDWLTKWDHPVSHHVLTADSDRYPEKCAPYRQLLEGRSMIVQKAEPLPVECIVRGYLSGSGWKEYLQKGSVSGVKLPAGLLESARLPEPIFTPSTKAAVGSHDMNISFEEMKGLIGAPVAEEVRTRSLQIYKAAAKKAEACGLIIADTKMEFGLDPKTRNLILIDELLTPDSSRFWPQSSYAPGKGQASFDKQFVRDYLLSIDWNGTPPPPHLPEKVVQQTSERYVEALKRLTSASGIYD
ncbi:MAG: phosphoribosylaminoimidazolesuccinocarboxamide synthase [Nitrospira sp.]|nr:phosphoribosylaminoimidazolesuccinocarboxamide synthase [Candidatus Manganitrophaceae bacterium]HIL34771.1 phosphoribosylaminoimidazolesuccinocarboxamide synthase [Candidatus Manganitrophaceae bacterium]